MGETEPRCYSTSTITSSSSTSSATTAAFLQDHDEEVALHPLNNQVHNSNKTIDLFFLAFSFFFISVRHNEKKKFYQAKQKTSLLPRFFIFIPLTEQQNVFEKSQSNFFPVDD